LVQRADFGCSVRVVLGAVSAILKAVGSWVLASAKIASAESSCWRRALARGSVVALMTLVAWLITSSVMNLWISPLNTL